jgi:hypothetical protein
MSETTQKVAELKQSSHGPVTLMPVRFTQDIAFCVPHSHATLPAGATLADVLKPEFWAHVAHKLVVGQRILIDAEDNSFSAQLKVHKCTRLEAVVSVEWEKSLATATLPEAADPADAYRVHFIPGGTAKWRVSRNSDNATMSEGHATKDIALRELKGHLQAMAA